MKFNCLNDIIEYFKLSTNSVEDIEKELKVLLKPLHPDSNQSDKFKNAREEKLYYEIRSALDFLDENKNVNSLTTKDEITALVEIVKTLTLVKEEKTKEDLIEKKEVVLTGKIQESIKIFHKSYSVPKITSLVLTGILTAMWLFPTTVKEHPVLSSIFKNSENSYIFVFFSFFSLFITSMIWIKVKVTEKRDNEIKSSYKLESTQNNIFSHFIKWKIVMFEKHKIDEKNGYVNVRFCRDDLIDFLINQYSLISRYMRLKRLNEFDEKYLWENLEFQNYCKDRYKHFKNNSSQSINFFPIVGEITLEIAQLVSDLIIERLKLKEIIVKSNEKNLSDYYEYKIE